MNTICSGVSKLLLIQEIPYGRLLFQLVSSVNGVCLTMLRIHGDVVKHNEKVFTYIEKRMANSYSPSLALSIADIFHLFVHILVCLHMGNKYCKIG